MENPSLFDASDLLLFVIAISVFVLILLLGVSRRFKGNGTSGSTDNYSILPPATERPGGTSDSSFHMAPPQSYEYTSGVEGYSSSVDYSSSYSGSGGGSGYGGNDYSSSDYSGSSSSVFGGGGDFGGGGSGGDFGGGDSGGGSSGGGGSE